MEEIQINDLTCTVIRSARKTLGLEIRPDGQILIRAPQRISRARITTFVKEKTPWILTHLEKLNSRQEAVGAVQHLTPQQRLRYQREAARIFPQRCWYYARKMGVTYQRITIREQKTRWGSCSSNRNLNFNWKLLLAPPEVLDYVVVHELCHLKEMNHSPAFWNEVRTVLPDYEQQKQWLKDNGWKLMEA